MAVEKATYISELNVSLPRSTDFLKEGDDHMRVIKTVLKSSWPNATKPLTFSAVSITNLGLAFDFTPTGFTSKLPIALAAGIKWDGQKSQVKNLAEPKDDHDLVPLSYIKKYLSTNIYAVGSIYATMKAGNPAQLLGFGTWERYHPGCILVSAAPDTIKAHDTEFGADATPLTADQLPVHNHPSSITFNIQPDGNHGHYYRAFWYWGSGEFNAWVSHDDWGDVARNQTRRTGDSGDHNHGAHVEGTVHTLGGSQPLSVVQPTITANIWIRRA